MGLEVLDFAGREGRLSALEDVDSVPPLPPIYSGDDQQPLMGDVLGDIRCVLCGPERS
jgi:hypothetical protein